MKLTIVQITQAMSAPSEEYFVSIAVANQMIAAKMPIGQTSAKRPPKKVATPLPPLNFNQIG